MKTFLKICRNLKCRQKLSAIKVETAIDIHEAVNRIRNNKN